MLANSLAEVVAEEGSKRHLLDLNQENVANTKLRTTRVKTMTLCLVDLRLKALAHPHDVCTEARVEMTGVQLCTTRNSDTPPRE